MEQLKKKIMNKIKMLIASVAAIFSCNAMAQKVTAADLDITPGSTADLVLSLEENTTVPASAQMYITLPEGVSIASPKKDYAEGEILDGDNVNINISKQDDGSYKVLIYHDKTFEFKAAEGTLLTLTLTASEDAASGAQNISIEKIKFATISETSFTCSDVAVALNVAETTGINGISADQLRNGEVFDMNGQKVSAVRKGVYVVNGKKVVVK